MYFSKFQKIWYDIDGSKKYTAVSNILQRVAFRKKLKSEGDLFVKYPLKDTDRPDIIADKLYGSSKFHWIVLLFNEYLNPYHEWVKTTETLEKIIKMKYKGFPVFVHGVTEDTGWAWKTGDTIQFIHDPENAQATIVGEATVLSTDKTLHKVVLDNVVGIFDSTSSGVGGGTGVLPDRYLAAPVGQQTAFQNKTKVLKIVYVHEQSIHHFEKDGITLNPLANSNGETYTGSIYQPIPVPFEPYTDVNGDPVDGTILWEYINNSNFDYVSFEQYEINKNEEARHIKLLRPEFLELVSKELEQLLNVR